MQPLIIQKYGGSSLSTPEKIRKAAARVARVREGSQGVVAVVSAMGDTTDELIALAQNVAADPRKGGYEREMDMLLSAGERVSMALLSMALRDLGVVAISFTGSQAGIITDESHTRARILEIRPMRVREELERGRVVIVAGFQGVSRGREVTTLGRGGSDTTAVALAAELGAMRCEILTDVPGIFSADPRVVPKARRYPRLPLDLAFELAAHGAQVMHPRSIEIAREKGFPVYVGLAHPERSDPMEEGTMMEPSSRGLELPTVTAVTARRGLRAVQYDSQHAREILDELARDSCLAYYLGIVPGEKSLTVLVDPNESSALLGQNPRGELLPETYAAVTAVGYQLQASAAVPARMLGILAAAGVKPAGLTCHSQSITVWFSESDWAGGRVLAALHDGLVGTA